MQPGSEFRGAAVRQSVEEGRQAGSLSCRQAEGCYRQAGRGWRRVLLQPGKQRAEEGAATARQAEGGGGYCYSQAGKGWRRVLLQPAGRQPGGFTGPASHRIHAGKPGFPCAAQPV